MKNTSKMTERQREDVQRLCELILAGKSYSEKAWWYVENLDEGCEDQTCLQIIAAIQAALPELSEDNAPEFTRLLASWGETLEDAEVLERLRHFPLEKAEHAQAWHKEQR